MSSSKAPAGRTTAPDAELFAIRLGVSKATSMDIERIILITDSSSPPLNSFFISAKNSPTVSNSNSPACHGTLGT